MAEEPRDLPKNDSNDSPAENPMPEAEGDVVNADVEVELNTDPSLADDNLAEQLAAAEAKAAENWDQFVRAKAEADNAMKRAQREIENARKFAVERFAGDLLTVVDSIDMGLQAASDDADVTSLREGMELTQKQLATVLERFNVETLNPVGEKFNPEFHEAMTMVPSPEHEPNSVMDVIQKGYTLNGRLLRPARVVVAKAP